MRVKFGLWQCRLLFVQKERRQRVNEGKVCTVTMVTFVCTERKASESEWGYSLYCDNADFCLYRKKGVREWLRVQFVLWQWWLLFVQKERRQRVTEGTVSTVTMQTFVCTERKASESELGYSLYCDNADFCLYRKKVVGEWMRVKFVLWQWWLLFVQKERRQRVNEGKVCTVTMVTATSPLGSRK